MKKILKFLDTLISITLLVVLVGVAIVSSFAGNYALTSAVLGVLTLVNTLIIGGIVVKNHELTKMVFVQSNGEFLGLLRSILSVENKDEDSTKDKKCHCSKAETPQKTKAKKKAVKSTEE